MAAGTRTVGKKKTKIRWKRVLPKMCIRDRYEIVMAIPTLGAEPSGLLDVENAVNEIVEPELGVKVTLYPISFFDLTSQQNLMITSGDKLDLASTIFSSLGSWVDKGAFMELDELYVQYGADIEKAEGRAMAGGYYNGKLYAIPVSSTHLRLQVNPPFILNCLQIVFRQFRLK